MELDAYLFLFLFDGSPITVSLLLLAFCFHNLGQELSPRKNFSFLFTTITNFPDIMDVACSAESAAEIGLTAPESGFTGEIINGK